jgi:hypothetical protein
MLSLVVFYFSSHYRIIVLPHYEPVPRPASVGYVQTISNDIARAFPRLVSPQSLTYVIVLDLISSCITINLS